MKKLRGRRWQNRNALDYPPPSAPPRVHPPDSGPHAADRPPRPLVVRLRNWVGDVVLGVPMLQRLSEAGYQLRLVGKGWAPDLLAGFGWPVEARAAGLAARVMQWRRLARVARAASPRQAGARHIDGLSLPFSFGSALEMRLAGLRTVGYAHEGRSPLLTQAVPRVYGLHELAVYWRLGDVLLGEVAPLPERIDWRIAPAARDQAAHLLAQHGVGPGFVMICPFAGGTFSKLDKRWPAFADFTRTQLATCGRPVLICPGPGEVDTARQDYPAAITLEGVSLGTYAALLSQAALMVSNDTGPGHLAAAVGVSTVSVLGPTNPAQWRAWGPSVRVVQCADRRVWPAVGEVWDACRPLVGMEG